MEKTITLTAEEANKLICYILMTTGYREREAAAWEKLAEEKAVDGTPKYKNAAANAEYFRELEKELLKIKDKLDS